MQNATGCASSHSQVPAADGYCNSRVAEFDASGAWVRDYKLPDEPELRQALELPHRWGGELPCCTAALLTVLLIFLLPLLPPPPQ